MKTKRFASFLILFAWLSACSKAPTPVTVKKSKEGTGDSRPDTGSSYDDDDTDTGGTDQDNDAGTGSDGDKDGTTTDPGTPDTDKPIEPSKSPEELLKESSASAMQSLDSYLSGNGALSDIEKQDFATLALTKEDAESARKKIFDALKKREADARGKELASAVIKVNNTSMKFLVKQFGSKPASGHSLYISLHGGGMTSPSVNDEQWRNQISLYQPSEGIYVAPRAPTDTWDLWQLPHIDRLLERMIANYIITGAVNPNRIYFMGYSAGGDGLYQLGPRMADRIAAGAMMAGHPGDASPISLRNIGYSIHVGADDSAYDRNKLAGEWLKKLSDLEKANSGSFKHFGRVVAGKGHWMDLVDKEAVPWMAGFTRNPFPKRVSWHQDDVAHQRFYWIRNPETKAHTELDAEINGQSIVIKDNMPGKIFVRLNDKMLDLGKDITIERNGKKKEGIKASRTLALVARSLLERNDPEAVFASEIEAP